MTSPLSPPCHPSPALDIIHRETTAENSNNTSRRKVEQFIERADVLERKLNSLIGNGGQQGQYFKDADAVV